MSVLETIGAFGEGFAGGAERGLNIYDRYQQIQDTNQKRQRTQRVEQRVKDLMDQGGFEDGPSGLEQTAQYWLDEGDTEQYIKYNSTAKQIRQADAQREGWNAFAVGQQDPVAGYELMNKMHEKMGDGVTYQVTQDPATGGFTVISNVNGRATPTTYKDRDELEYSLHKSLEPTLFADAKDYGEYQKTQAEGALAGARTQGELAKQPWEVAKIQADIGQSEASAASSYATAGATGAKLPAEIEALQARAAASRAQAETAGKTPEDTIAAIIDKTSPKPDPMSDEPVAYYDNPVVRHELSRAIAAANPHIPGGEAVGISDQLLRDPDPIVDDETGMAQVGGVAVKIGTAAIDQLKRAQQLAAQPPPE